MGAKDVWDYFGKLPTIIQFVDEKVIFLLCFRSNAMMPNLEAVNYSEAARNKVAGEATPLLSIKALNKLRNNGKFPLC